MLQSFEGYWDTLKNGLKDMIEQVREKDAERSRNPVNEVKFAPISAIGSFILPLVAVPMAVSAAQKGIEYGAKKYKEHKAKK
jgi:hypothetical protein